MESAWTWGDVGLVAAVVWCFVDMLRWLQVRRLDRKFRKEHAIQMRTRSTSGFGLNASDCAEQKHMGKENLAHTRVSMRRYAQLIRDLLNEEEDLVMSIRGIFRGRELAEIPRGAVTACVAYFLSGCDEQCAQKGREYVEEAEDMLEQWTQREPRLRELADVPWDPAAPHALQFSRADPSFDLVYHFRPLPVQLAIDSVLFYKRHVLLRMAGFRQQHLSPDIIAWVRPGRSAAKPLYILHGIGAGVAPYVSKLMSHVLPNFPDRTIVLPEIMALTGSILFEARGDFPEPRQYADMLHAHLGSVVGASGTPADARADVMAHSYGTVVLTFWRRFYPDDFDLRLYVDPMCVGTTIGKYISWGYEEYLGSALSIVSKSPEPLVEYLVKTTLPAQRLAKRKALLSDILENDNSCWDRSTMLLICENDRYLNSRGLRSRFTRHGFASKMVTVKGWRHGGFILQPDKDDVWGQHIIPFLRGEQ